MILKIFTIRDRAIDAYGRPFFAPTAGAAIRSFGDELNRQGEDNAMGHHADDYDLYAIGEYNDFTGLFGTHEPQMIAIGKQHKI